jgi:PEP-CTERM motif
MKKILMLAALALALPTAVFAGSIIDFNNGLGTLSVSPSGLSLAANLTMVTGLNGPGTIITGNDLGNVSFSTGMFISTVGTGTGSVTTFAAGGSFLITGKGSNGIPNGVLFTGTFSSPVTLTLTQMVDGTNFYELQGNLSGTTASGYKTSGGTYQVVFNTGKGLFDGSWGVTSGDTPIVVPEPGSLGLLGAGLIGLGGVVRRKLKA